MITATVMAKIDGDQLERVMKLAPMQKAQWRVCFEISLGGSTLTCDTLQDVLDFIEVMRPSPTSGEQS